MRTSAHRLEPWKPNGSWHEFAENLSLTGRFPCRRIVVMGRGGSDWQRQMAAQRREAERQARETARLAKEREKLARERYLAARQQEAEAKTGLIEAEVKTLDEILTSILTLAPLTFQRHPERSARKCPSQECGERVRATANACGRKGRVRPERCSRADEGCAA